MKRPAHPSYEMFIRLCLLGLFALGSCRPVHEREVSGKVLSIEGGGQRKIGGESVGLTKSDWVKSGETILSSENSQIDLMLLPGMLVEMAANSEITIDRLRLARDGDESIHPMTKRAARIRLLRGTLVATVGRVQTRTRLAVETPTGTLTAGSERTFKISVADGWVRVMCVRGRTVFEPAQGGALIKIGAGYVAEWPSAVTEPTAASAAGANAQAELVAVLATERRLRQLQKSDWPKFIPWKSRPETVGVTPSR